MTEKKRQLDQDLVEVASVLDLLGRDLHWPKDKCAGISEVTSLDRDLGIDSLSRVELIGRLERQFHVSLGEKVYTDVDTIGDLIRAIHKAQEFHQKPTHNVGKTVSRLLRPYESDHVPLPTTARTLGEVLEFHVAQNASRTHMILCEDGVGESSLTYKDLKHGAMEVAAGLVRRGVRPGDAVSIMLPSCKEYFFCFLGTILAGGIPVPIYPPNRPSQLEDHLMRHSEILKNCSAKILVTTSAMSAGLGRLLKLKAGTLELITSPQELRIANEIVLHKAQSSDLAFLQYTSGSTGSPKGVMLTHANLLANIRAMGTALAAGPQDIFVSWLPLYHDMGLIGAWLGSFYFACQFVVMSPFAFLSRPQRWLSTVQKYGGTLTAAPNFAYELCMRHISDDEVRALDLRTLRVMCNGAESVIPETVERFISRFSLSGLRPGALMPVYGLAESTVGLQFPPLGRGLRIDVIERDKFLKSGRALRSSAEKQPSEVMRFVGCGQPLLGHETRIVDGGDHEVPERQEGFIQFRGPSSTLGYLRREDENKTLFHGEWLNTGDLGYLAEGDLFVTGRIKDIIKRAGRNIHPEELETAVGRISGVRKGCVAAFGSVNDRMGTEKLVIVAETREQDHKSHEQLKASINQVIADMLGSPPDDVALAPAHSVLKTSSGKIRRSATAKIYERGKIGKRAIPKSLVLARFMLAAIPAQLGRKISSIGAIVRALTIWILVGASTAMLWPLMVLWPTLDGRWKITRFGSQIAARLAGIEVTVIGKENLRRRPCVIVANHASYADVVVLFLALPFPVTFVAKSELKRVKGLRWTLERLGVVFVERYDVKQSIADAKRTVELAVGGHSLMTFPEGTFTRRQGVLPFHMGPFLTAVETGLPVFPIAIIGTRSILHPDSWILRSGSVGVHFLPAIECKVSVSTDRSPWQAAILLRDAARGKILEHCGEVDLIGDSIPRN